MSDLRCEYRRGVSPDALADLPDGCAAAVVTDPPYGLGVGYGRRENYPTDAARRIANDADLSALESCVSEIKRLLAPDGVAVVHCAPSMRRAVEAVLERVVLVDGAWIQTGLDIAGPMPWDKGAPGLGFRRRFAYEEGVIAVQQGYEPFEAREPLILPLRVSRVADPEHPNEKPVELLRRQVRWACPNGGLVLDPFAGIASCGVAALAERCSYVGVECDERWWPIAERRLAEAQDRPHPLIQQSTLFTDVA